MLWLFLRSRTFWLMWTLYSFCTRYTYNILLSIVYDAAMNGQYYLWWQRMGAIVVPGKKGGEFVIVRWGLKITSWFWSRGRRWKWKWKWRWKWKWKWKWKWRKMRLMFCQATQGQFFVLDWQSRGKLKNVASILLAITSIMRQSGAACHPRLGCRRGYGEIRGVIVSIFLYLQVWARNVHVGIHIIM